MYGETGDIPAVCYQFRSVSIEICYRRMEERDIPAVCCQFRSASIDICYRRMEERDIPAVCCRFAIHIFGIFKRVFYLNYIELMSK